MLWATHREIFKLAKMKVNLQQIPFLNTTELHGQSLTVIPKLAKPSFTAHTDRHCNSEKQTRPLKC